MKLTKKKHARVCVHVAPSLDPQDRDPAGTKFASVPREWVFLFHRRLSLSLSLFGVRFTVYLLPLWVSCETAPVAATRAAEPPRDLKNGRVNVSVCACCRDECVCVSGDRTRLLVCVCVFVSLSLFVCLL